MNQQVITYYLEMTDPSELRRSQASVKELEIRRAGVPSPELNRFLYTAVGGDWFWTDRLSWTYQQWYDYLNRPELETWVAYLDGTPAGYFELEMQKCDQVELIYFGLLPHFIGRGIGGLLLTKAVERGWQMGAKRIWLHTCTLDSPAALGSYQARGFHIYREIKEEKQLPEISPGPWSGAR